VNNTYSKAFRLRKSYQFRQVFQQGCESKGKYIILCAYHHSKKDDPKLGVVASKYFGNAIVRNRFKRISREAFRRVRTSLPKGFQLVLKPRKYALRASMAEILEELLKLSNEILEKGYEVSGSTQRMNRSVTSCQKLNPLNPIIPVERGGQRFLERPAAKKGPSSPTST